MRPFALVAGDGGGASEHARDLHTSPPTLRCMKSGTATAPGLLALTGFVAWVGADVSLWLLARFAPDTACRLVLATPPSMYDAADAGERARADALLESIRAPTLCIGAPAGGVQRGGR